MLSLAPNQNMSCKFVCLTAIGLKEHLRVAEVEKKPFYQQWWFLVIVALTGLILIIIVISLLCLTGRRAVKYKGAPRQSLCGGIFVCLSAVALFSNLFFTPKCVSTVLQMRFRRQRFTCLHTSTTRTRTSTRRRRPDSAPSTARRSGAATENRRASRRSRRTPGEPSAPTTNKQETKNKFVFL